MKYGLALPNFGKYASPETIRRFALEAEKLGFDSLWVSEHIVIPQSHNVFGDVFYEPLTTLGFVAALTDSIKIGTSIIVLPYRNPVVLAKSLSTLDVLSKGRLIIGIGAGWMEEEFKALNANFEDRGEVTDEYLEIIKILFTDDNPVFRGSHNSFSDIKFFPKPLQKPHPPIWVGGNSKRALERTKLYGQGWHTVGLVPDQITSSLQTLDTETRKRLTISVRKNLQITDKPVNNERELLRGDTEKIISGLKEYSYAGVDHIVFQILSGELEEIFNTMEIFCKEIRNKI